MYPYNHSEMTGPMAPIGKLSVTAKFAERAEQGCFAQSPEKVQRGIFSIIRTGENEEDLGTLCSTAEIVTDKCVVYTAIVDLAMRHKLPLYMAEPLANQGVSIVQRQHAPR